MGSQERKKDLNKRPKKKHQDRGGAPTEKSNGNRKLRIVSDGGAGSGRPVKSGKENMGKIYTQAVPLKMGKAVNKPLLGEGGFGEKKGYRHKSLV